MTEVQETGQQANATGETSPQGRTRLDLNEMPELLTVRQAANCLGVGRSTLYRLLSEGSLPLTRIEIGRDVRLAKRELKAWLENPTSGSISGRGSRDELIRIRGRRAS